MISENELLVLLSTAESDGLKKTTSTKNTSKFSEAVCAFANDLPDHRKAGYLLIGVKDDGSLSGVSVDDKLLLGLSVLRSDGNILPQPVINVAKFVLPQGEVAVVEVLPSDLPPVRYQGRVWIRVGPSKRITSEQEERILTEKRVAQATSFDTKPVAEADLETIDKALFFAYRSHVIAHDIIEENHRGIKKQLASLRLSLAMEAHKPMFFLKSADGAIGSHVKAVQGCYRDFKQLAARIVQADSPHEDNVLADIFKDLLN